MDLVLEEGQAYVFDVVGKKCVFVFACLARFAHDHTAHSICPETTSVRVLICAWYVSADLPPEQNPTDFPPDDDEILDDEEEEAFRLEDVSSDVEVPADALDEDDEEYVSTSLPHRPTAD